jgi:hypothetical protein
MQPSGLSAALELEKATTPSERSDLLQISEEMLGSSNQVVISHSGCALYFIDRTTGDTVHVPNG